MGWISKRCHATGRSIRRGSTKKHKGPLRKIVAMIRSGRSIFEPDKVELECGHIGRSWGGVRARCRECGRTDPRWLSP